MPFSGQFATVGADCGGRDAGRQPLVAPVETWMVVFGTSRRRLRQGSSPGVQLPVPTPRAKPVPSRIACSTPRRDAHPRRQLASPCLHGQAEAQGRRCDGCVTAATCALLLIRSVDFPCSPTRTAMTCFWNSSSCSS